MKGASQIAPLGVRIPDDLKEKIQVRARKNGRSMNSEIVQILQDAIDGNNGNLIAWSDDLSPKSNEDKVVMSTSQLSKVVNIAVDEATKALLEKFDILPKDNKKPT